MLEQISSEHLSEWIAFFNLEPFGSEVDFVRSGIIASTIVNTFRDPKKSSPASVRDFVPDLSPKSEDQKTEDMKKLLLQMGGKVDEIAPKIKLKGR